MKKKGLAVTLAVAGVALLAWSTMMFAPEFRRYMRIRQM
jgi:hypothetical protein